MNNKEITDLIILLFLIYLFSAYIIFLVKAVIYGKEKIYGSKNPTFLRKIVSILKIF